MTKKMVITGGTGFLGKSLTSHFSQNGFQVIVLTRRKNTFENGVRFVNWTENDTWQYWIQHAHVIINLNGKSVDCRYTIKNKKEILQSRIWATRRIGECLLKKHQKDLVWINASTATIYEDTYDVPNTENSKKIGNDFSMSVAKQWEETLFSFEELSIRKIALRTSLVLDNNGGVLPVLIKHAKFGVGGYQGSGKQKFAWLHIADFVRIISHVITSKIQGPINCTSPINITNKQFNSLLRKSLGLTFGINTPTWLVKFGCFLLQTEPELILKSRYVYPEKLLKSGYSFLFPDMDQALTNLIKKEG